VYVRDMEFTDSLWPQQSQRFAAGLFASVSRLSHMINEFERALHDLVRKAFDPWEARVRLDDLNCLFDPPRARGVLSAG